MKNDHEFSLTWHIYDLDYGVPKIVENWLSDGNIVIINVSRTIIPLARIKFPNLKVIFVKVPFEITLAFIIPNEDHNSEDYDHLKNLYRPSHADFTYEKKYGIREL